MKRTLGVFLLVLGLLLSWSMAIAGDFYVITAKKHTSWDKKIPGVTRFKLVLDGEGVLDRETGLVWQKHLCTTYAPPGTCESNWSTACHYCYNMEMGGLKGWRLPTIEELASLVDPTQSNPSLPKNHPFNYVRPEGYWSSTTDAGSTSSAWTVFFSYGAVGTTVKEYDQPYCYVWCVRGGYGHDAY